MQKIILHDHPNARISVSIVWINMLPSDNSNTARRAAQIINDKRVRHFYDPKRKVGNLIGQSLGDNHRIAWDIYLFYSAASVWKQNPPFPIAWAHQSSDSWLEHYHYGDDLEKELDHIAERLLETE